jgi:hypothetical protein
MTNQDVRNLSSPVLNDLIRAVDEVPTERFSQDNEILADFARTLKMELVQRNWTPKSLDEDELEDNFFNEDNA